MFVFEVSYRRTSKQEGAFYTRKRGKEFGRGEADRDRVDPWVAPPLCREKILTREAEPRVFDGTLTKQKTVISGSLPSNLPNSSICALEI